MSKIELVELKAGEKPRVVELAGLAREIWTEHYEPIIGMSQVEYMLERYQSADKILSDISSGGYRYFIAYVDGKMSGYCAARPECQIGSLFLSKLYVEKNSRGKGISRLMLDRLISMAEEKGLKYVWLTVNKYNSTSIQIYNKMGFKIVEEMVTDIGSGYVMDDYKMQLALCQS